MSQPWLTILAVPSMAVAPLALMQNLHRSGAEIVVDPLSGLAQDRAAILTRLRGLAAQDSLPEGSSARIVVLPGTAALDRITLQDAGMQHARIIRMDSADPTRAVIRALRIEAWILDRRARDAPHPLPIPADAGFRITTDAQRFKTMLQEIQIGRALLAAFLGDAPSGWLRFDDETVPDPALLAELGLTDPAPLAREPLSDLVADEDALRNLIRRFRVDSPDVDLPALPALHSRNRPAMMAYVCGRNISSYLPVMTDYLRAQDVPLTYIDNGSDDGSSEIAAELVGRGITELHHLPYAGAFSLQAQLQAKQRLMEVHAPEWVLHMDADEILQSRQPGQGLHDLAAHAKKSGYNAVNFDEFVFLPRPGEDFSGRDYLAEMTRYYFLNPMPYRLIRMWRHGVGLSNLDSAGHRLTGPLKLSPVSHNLRHYIALSERAAQRKYVGRSFSADELARNWHRNRVGLAAEDLAMPDDSAPQLNHLPDPASADLRRDNPVHQHWWTWPKTTAR
ncbi:Glycosyltransferase involved in cell wall bisynthesis [Paracoccus isoporae]|uniref:Glycosyltransferase involved in cell wall bisynthesis n=2 Tax=Paracoccus isoporae TaxID=591205 RepID=A0A1G6XEH9_9RHOB|nr:Glycosyltransferase involved in cell wall bisynthesis [Paracoccus isoporae]